MSALKIIVPVAVGVLVLALWQFLVRHYQVPVYLLPAPSDIWQAFIESFAELMSALWVTLRIVVLAFLLALATGVALAILFSQSRVVELALYPYAVILQVTPVIAIAPLIIIWVGYDRVDAALLILAWIVAFFPILANTTLGLRSADRNLIELFKLYGGSRWQMLTRLQMPGALPYLMSAMKVSGGLALVGTIVAEFAAGSGTDTGMGWTIIEASRNLHIAKLFAALALLSLLGIAIFFALSALEWLVLHRWHESALRQER
ncbi:MAG: ABC transporter permease [Rhizomicrobium sp.]